MVDLEAIDKLRHEDPASCLTASKRALKEVSWRELPWALGVYGSALRVEGHIPEAHRALAGGLKCARKISNRMFEADLLQRASYVVADSEDYEEALELSELALLTYALIADHPGIGKATLVRATWFLALDRFKDATAAYESALSYLPKSFQGYRHSAVHGLGLVNFQQGKFDEALSYLNEAVNMSDGLGPLLRAKSAWLKASLLAHRGALKEACEAYDLTIQNLAPSPIDAGLASLELIKLLYKNGEALQALKVARTMAGLIGPVSMKSRLAGATLTQLVNLAFQGETTILDTLGRCEIQLMRLRQQGTAAQKQDQPPGSVQGPALVDG